MKKVIPLQAPLMPGFRLDKEYVNLVFELTYPISNKVRIKIPRANNINDIIEPILKECKKIYEDPEKFGVPGHSSEQLFFEEILINENGLSEVRISDA